MKLNHFQIKSWLPVPHQRFSLHNRTWVDVTAAITLLLSPLESFLRVTMEDAFFFFKERYSWSPSVCETGQAGNNRDNLTQTVEPGVSQPSRRVINPWVTPSLLLSFSWLLPKRFSGSAEDSLSARKRLLHMCQEMNCQGRVTSVKEVSRVPSVGLRRVSDSDLALLHQKCSERMSSDRLHSAVSTLRNVYLCGRGGRSQQPWNMPRKPAREAEVKQSQATWRPSCFPESLVDRCESGILSQNTNTDGCTSHQTPWSLWPEMSSSRFISRRSTQ